MIEIEFSNQQTSHPVDEARLTAAAAGVLEAAGIRRATVDEIAAVPTLTKAVATKIKDYLAEG